jgi:hypothetical protein
MKTKGIIALFVALVIILALNPRVVFNMYDSVVGRLALIAIIIFFSICNTTLGLLLVLALIIVLNRFTTFTEGFSTFTEGLTTLDTVPSTVGEDNVPITGEQQVLTRSASSTDKKDPQPSPKISEIKATNPSVGVDIQDIQNAIMPKDSKTLPTDPQTMKSSENVAAHSSDLLNKSSLTEGFCGSCLSSYNLYDFKMM